MTATDAYSGMTEAEALAAAAPADDRVVERDGKCLGRSRDLVPGRVNLVVADRRVVYAAVERATAE